MVVRVRFAPSPTGFLHLGGLRTALFNYLYAAGNNGTLILRIEDTDQSRVVPGSVEYFQNTFKWLGIQFEEGPSMGGPHAPYIQSQRLSLYRQYAQDLVKRNGAYHCFCSKERLESLRARPVSGRRRGYDGLCRGLSSREVEKKLQMGTPNVVRLKVPSDGCTTTSDVVYGEVKVKNEDIDDQVLLKADGYPTYHLANVVDDHIMEISHILRGEEWMPSTCKHLLLYQAFGWPVPVFAHLPLLMSGSGGKLSKRNKNVHIQSYKERGYSPEGLINFVALLGWNPNTKKEIFRLQELIDSFSLEGINKSAAIVDEGRLNWLNSVHAQRLFTDEARMTEFVNDLRMNLLSRKEFGLTSRDRELDSSYLFSIITLIQERTCLIPNIPNQAPYFWVEPKVCAEKLKSICDAPDRVLEDFVQLTVESSFTRDALLHSIKLLNSTKAKSLIRQIVTGGMPGPDIADTMVIIGKEKTINRLKRGLTAIRGCQPEL